MCKRQLQLRAFVWMLSLALASEAQAADPSLMAQWRLDEGSGTVATDTSGNGRNGTLHAGAAWAPGMRRTGVFLDGIDDYIEVPVALAEQGTIAFWFKPRWNGTDPDDYRIFDASLGGIYFFLSKGANEANITQGEIGFYFEDSTDADYQNIEFDPRSVVFADTWFHLAATWDFGGGSAVLYFNGKEVARRDGLGPFPALDPTPNFGFQTYAYQPQTHGATGTIDEIVMYNRPLAAGEIAALMVTTPAGLASDPSPADDATDVLRDANVGWTAGAFARTHDVYLGTAFADVNDASRTNAKGVLASQGQTATEFDPPEPLEYGRTYFWRIDEVNGAPDNAILKGEVWSFTIESYGYPVKPVAATAASSQPGMGPEKTIDSSGLDKMDLHGIEPTTMWLSAGAQPNWIQYELDKVYKLHELQVWNSNQLIESFLGFGARKVTIETSTDGATWTPVANVPEFSQAAGTPDYAADTTVSLGGVEAKYVKLTISTNWGGVAPQAGLAEVRFFYVPVQARAPQPANATKDVAVDTTLAWRPGREAISHKVFFGTDPNALGAAKTATDHSFDPGALSFGTKYYWKVDEVNTVTYPGNVWSFTTQEFAAIDDFESYTDKAGEEVFSAWIDGFTGGTNGSTVGYLTASNGTFGETRIVHGGKQSMPLAYDNTKAPNFSEAERTFSPAQDWTGNGAEDLVLYFRGSAPGFVETASGSIVMNAIGTDIWNNGDQFRFAYKSLSGDGTMVARVDAVFNSNVWAKGGVMIRQSIQPGSVHAFMPITPGGASAGNGASFQHRLAANGASTNNDSTTLVAAPYWVKIERKGNNFSGYISPDSVTWTQLGTAQTITMTNPVLIGLALCSHDAAIATSAAFSNVSTTGNVTGTWQVAEIGAAQPAGNSVEGLYLSVKDSSGKTKAVQHPDAAATASMSWQQWTIPLSEFTAAGVKMNAVKSLTVGVGNKAAPKAGGTGTVYLDDIGYGRPIR